MRGLTFTSPQSFAMVFASLMPDFARWCWLIDVQSGPFALSSLGSVEARRLEKSLVEYALDAPALAETSASLWRAGVFPTFAEHLIGDEWSYLIGLDEATIVAVAETLVRAPFLFRGILRSGQPVSGNLSARGRAREVGGVLASCSGARLVEQSRIGERRRVSTLAAAQRIAESLPPTTQLHSPAATSCSNATTSEPTVLGSISIRNGTRATSVMSLEII